VIGGTVTRFPSLSLVLDSQHNGAGTIFYTFGLTAALSCRHKYEYEITRPHSGSGNAMTASRLISVVEESVQVIVGGSIRAAFRAAMVSSGSSLTW
jgi:hypothetical protein